MHGYTLKYTIKLFILAFLVFLATDMVWLGLIAKNLYLNYYSPWLRLDGAALKPNWWAGVMVYLLFALSIIIFVLPLAKNNLLYAAYYGALLGAVVYGVYDFTCLAIFKNFPLTMGVIDWLWGIVLYAWVAMFTFVVAG